MIQAAWSTQKVIKEVMVFLQGHGVSTTYAVKIYKQYSDAAIETVTNNPYQLSTGSETSALHQDLNIDTEPGLFMSWEKPQKMGIASCHKRN